VRHGLLLPLAIKPHGDMGIEDEGVPGEPAAWQKRCRDALEGAPTIGPGGQMQQRAERQ
jgi:hypothetical protein